jgi:hypothetical protein
MRPVRRRSDRLIAPVLVVLLMLNVRDSLFKYLVSRLLLMAVLQELRSSKILVRHRLLPQVTRVQTATRNIFNNHNISTTITMACISHHRRPVPAILCYPPAPRAHPILSRDLRRQ